MPFFRTIAIPVIAAGLLAASAASAEPPASPAPRDVAAASAPDEGPEAGRPAPRFHGGPMGGHLFHLRGIVLSEAQQDRLFALLHAQAPQLREHEKNERKAREALRALGESGQFDEARASAQSKALGAAIAARELQRARTASQIMALLTLEQRRQLEQSGRAPSRSRQ